MIFLSSIAGFFAGLIHALSGPDHVAAMAPLVSNAKERQWAIGLRWGLGHSGGAIFIGILAIILRGAFDVEILSGVAEWAVGVTLILIGLWGLHKAFVTNLHVHEHDHGDHEHVHVHVHTHDQEHQQPMAHRHTHAAFAVGMLHGLAGGSHILGVLPALALPTTTDAVFYLLFFGAGTVAAMIGFASLLGKTAQRFFRGEKGYRQLMSGCSAVAIVVGAAWLVI